MLVLGALIGGAISIAWEKEVLAECHTGTPFTGTDSQGNTPASDPYWYDATGEGILAHDLSCRFDTDDLDPNYGHFEIFYNDPDPADTCTYQTDCDCDTSLNSCQRVEAFVCRDPDSTDDDTSMKCHLDGVSDGQDCTADSDCYRNVCFYDGQILRQYMDTSKNYRRCSTVQDCGFVACVEPPGGGQGVCNSYEEVTTEAVENMGYYLECAWDYLFGDLSDGAPFPVSTPDDFPIWIIDAVGSGHANYQRNMIYFPARTRLFRSVTSNAIHELAHFAIHSSMSELFNGNIELINEGYPTMLERALQNDNWGYHLRDVPMNFNRFVDISEQSLQVMGYESAVPFWGFAISLADSSEQQYYAFSDMTNACQNYYEDAVAEGRNFSPDWHQNGAPDIMRRLHGRAFLVDVLNRINECVPEGNFDEVGTYQEIQCSGEPGTTGRAIMPDLTSFSEAAVNQLRMLKISQLIDESVAGFGYDLSHYLDDPVGNHAVYRMYLEKNYTYSPSIRTDSRSFRYSEQDDEIDRFSIDSFAAHYHTIDVVGRNSYVTIEPEDDLRSWAYGAFYIDRSDPNAVILRPVWGVTGWKIGTTAAAHETIPFSSTYGGDVVIIVTALGGTYHPEETDQVCTYEGEEICGYTCSARAVAIGQAIGCYESSSGHYYFSDLDGDGVENIADNCVDIPNPNQENCDELDDENENVEYGLRGDACDPDLCVSYRDVPTAIHTFTSIDAGRFGMFTIGDQFRFSFKNVGAAPADPFAPGNNRTYAGLSTHYQAKVRMSHCQCEPGLFEEDCRYSQRDCRPNGFYGEDWHDSTWSLSNSAHHQASGLGGDAPRSGELMSDPDDISDSGLWFTRPGHHGNQSAYQVDWDWREDFSEEDLYARIWMRPEQSLLRADHGWTNWDDTRGNSYTPDLIHLRRYDEILPFVPVEAVHGSIIQDLWLVNPPRAIDLAGFDFNGDCRPWCDLYHEGFEIPSLVMAKVGPNSQLIGSRYQLPQSSRSTTNVIMVRHQRSETGYVSTYVPLAFSGQTRLDYNGFASTVMAETPSDPNGVQDFNEVLSIWAFGGQTLQGQYLNELWRGTLSGTGKDAVYQFERIAFTGGPAGRRDGMLVADTFNQRLLSIGGRSGQALPQVWIFNIATRKWTYRGDVILPAEMGISGAAWYVSGRYAYIYGGLKRTGGNSSTLWRLDLRTLNIVRLSGQEDQNAPSERWGASLSVDAAEGKVYLFGGRNNQGQWTNEIRSYDIENGMWELVSPSCQTGPSCPPAAMGSALLPTLSGSSITIGIGTPEVPWEGTDYEWRYIFWQDRWVSETEDRNETWSE